MLLEGRDGLSTTTGPRPISLGLSVLAHACVIVLIGSPRAQLPKSKSAYDQLIKGREHKLVWYHFKEKLPEVRPTVAKPDHRPLRATVRIPNQQIVSSPKHAPKASQMIWQKAPEINTDIKFDSANVVAVRLEKVDPPKQFVPPVPQTKRLYDPQIETTTPPEVQANAAKAPVSTELAKVDRPLRDFKAPNASPRKRDLPQIDVATAPDLRGNAGTPVEIASRGLPDVARPLRDFRAPPSRPKAGPPKITEIDPSPSLAAGGGGPKTTGVEQVAETSLGKVYRPFGAPPASQKNGAKHGVAVPVLPSAPPPEEADGTAGELNAVVVSLNPGNQLPALPPVSRPADFSAGPKLHPKGGTGDGSDAGVHVPDLTIRSGNIDTRSTIMAKNTPPKGLNRSDPAETLREAAKYITVDEIGRPSATRVTNAPDSRFDGRAVYMMAIQMPNITSYVGSWLMWYSERTARPISTAVITAPVVHRKVDPKYIAEAISEHVEGTVRLAAVIRKDGTVGSVELLRGLDARLDRTAEEALAKWQFAPAMRNNEAIDVDILVEIPFRLAPRLER
jgi:TonB family protein